MRVSRPIIASPLVWQTHGESNHRPGAMLSEGSHTVLPTVRFSPATTVSFTAAATRSPWIRPVQRPRRIGGCGEDLPGGCSGDSAFSTDGPVEGLRRGGCEKMFSWVLRALRRYGLSSVRGVCEEDLVAGYSAHSARLRGFALPKICEGQRMRRRCFNWVRSAISADAPCLTSGKYAETMF